MNPARRTAAAGALLVAAGALALVAARRTPRQPWRLGVRLVDEIAAAVEVPRAPAVRRFLWLDELPRFPGARQVAVPFRAEALRPFVVRARVDVGTGGAAALELRALTDAEAREFGSSPRRLSGPIPGAFAGELQLPPDATGTEVVQRVLSFSPGASAGLLVVTHPERGVREIGIEEADTASPTAPAVPALRPLIKHLPLLSETGHSWRDCLIAPGGGRYSFDVVLPPGAELVLATGLEPGEQSAPAQFIVSLDGRVLVDETVRDATRWNEHRLALPGAAGTRARLLLETRPVAGEPGIARGVWAGARILAAGDRPNILLLTLDAVRSDRLGAYGYPRDTSPALQRVAAAGIRFDRATAQGARTWTSIPSLLSGLQPSRAGVRTRGARLPPTLRLLPQMLASRGYDTFAGSDLASFPPVFLGRFDDADCLRPGARSAAELAAQLDAQMRRVAGMFRRGPAFAWLHLENAHYPLRPSEPLRYDPGYQGRFKLGFSRAEHDAYPVPGSLTEAEMRHVSDLYDAAVRDADALVRRMLVLLDAAGATENTIVVITADHGEAIGEHGLVLDHDLPWDPILRVPLIVAWPGHLPAGRTVSQRVQLVDLVPTLLSLAGVAPEPGLDGRDLSQLLRGGALPEAPAYAEVGGRIRVQYRGDEKLVLAPPGLTGRASEIPQRALFDVGSDPQERDDRSSLEPLRAAAAEAALRAWMALEDRDEAGETAPSQAAIEALQQAGYLPLGLAAAHAEEGSP